MARCPPKAYWITQGQKGFSCQIMNSETPATMYSESHNQPSPTAVQAREEPRWSLFRICETAT